MKLIILKIGIKIADLLELLNLIKLSSRIRWYVVWEI